MPTKQIYLAVDLGAGSGRVLAGEFSGDQIKLVELSRFDNTPLQLPSGWHWNLPALYQNILNGLKIAFDTYGDAIVSLGIDTWGVDYGLFDKDGRILGLPYQYRDSRTDGMIELADKKVGKANIYAATGIQFLFFNSLYQLLSEAEAGSAALNAAEDLLFMPDLLTYWLTGKKYQELSIASTSQLYNPKHKDWDRTLIKSLGLPEKLFKSIRQPGTGSDPLTEAAKAATGLTSAKVVSVAGHDTASAVAAVPSKSANPAYLSSGTWSLMGLELDAPVINEAAFQDAFTNEVGLGGKIRFLKNMCGLWLIQESRRHWLSEGVDIGYGEMAKLANEASPFRSIINPDDPSFIQAGNMPVKIQAYCEKHGQPVPKTKGAIIRCIYESLALRYESVWKNLIKYAPQRPEVLHIVGGGCQDHLLNQFTANVLNVRVAAGPVEATGLGNILAQLLADGRIKDLQEGRDIIANTVSPKIFEPADQASWSQAVSTYSHIFE